MASKHLSTRRFQLEVEVSISEREGSDGKPIFTSTISMFGCVVATASNTDRASSELAVKDAFVRKLAGR